jgi:hypothetical protein
MEIIKVDRSNLASVLMGKQIQFPWRGQKGVVISVPFHEWLAFVQEYKDILNKRNPLNYSRMLTSDNIDMKVRYFFYDISWALYSELACSSNIRKDATLILPYFDHGKSIFIGDVLAQIKSMSLAEIDKCHSSLKAATRNYYNIAGQQDVYYGLVDVQSLSDWNTLVYEICMFIQSRSSNKRKTEQINIDWRITGND